MAEHAPSTPAPAADGHSPQWGAAALWGRYKAAMSALCGVRLGEAIQDTLLFALNDVQRAAMAAPIVTPEDAVAAAEMAVDSLKNGPQMNDLDHHAAELLEAWIKNGGTTSPGRLDRLTYLARLHERLTEIESAQEDLTGGPDVLASSEADCLSAEAALWLDVVRAEAEGVTVRSPEGVAFAAALIVRAVDRARSAPEREANQHTTIERLAEAIAEHVGGRRLLPLTFKALAGEDWHTRVADLMGGFGPDGRVQLPDAA